MKNIIAILKVIAAASFVSAAMVGTILTVHLTNKPDTQEPDLPRGMSEILEEKMPDPQSSSPEDKDEGDTFPVLPNRKDSEAKENPQVPGDSDAAKDTFQPQTIKEDPAECPPLPDLDYPDEDSESSKPPYEDDCPLCPPLPDIENPDEDTEIQKPPYASDPAPCY